jgi:beta-galactosidase
VVTPAVAQPSPATRPADRTPISYYPIDQRPEFAMSLNGTWKFKLSPVDAAAFAKPDFDDTAWKPIQVPGNWELQGFEDPTYGVKIPDTEGFYRRTFVVPETWQGRPVFLRFESVSFGFEFWVNGKHVGGLDSAFNRSEFDITNLIEFGRPVSLAVRATRRSKGWDFDAHDDWSLSGIQRDVVLFSLPDVHLKDYTITTTLQDSGKQATVAFKGFIENSSGKAGNATLDIKVLNPQGKSVGSLTKAVTLNGASAAEVAGDIPIQDPQLWNSESPTLYTLNLDLVTEGQHVHLVTQRVGLREITIDNGVFKLNGKPIKFHGVNHHDLQPDTGRSMTREQYVKDLEMMKAANINAIRMAHYPPQKMFLDLCDQYGMYVLDEVPFGDFGSGKAHLDDDSYEDNLFLRARATVGRDKNQTCVMLWTVGNECPYTPLIVRTAGLVKELDPSRPRCLAHPTDKYFFPLPPELSVVDIHYLQPAAPNRGSSKPTTKPVLEDLFKRPDVTAPVMMSEFAHAQGTGLEDLKHSWEVIESSDRFMGGCVWMFQDQGLYRTVTPDSYPGLPKVVDSPPVVIGKINAQTWVAADRAIDTGAAAGKDGIVEADRFPKSSYFAVRKIFSPVFVPIESLPVRAGRQTLSIPVENRYDFTDLSAISGTWELHVDGHKTVSGPVSLHAAPRTKTTFEVTVDLPDQTTSHDLFLRLSFVDKGNHAIVENAIRLLPSSAEMANPFKSWLQTDGPGKIAQTEQGSTITYEAGKSRLQVNRETGNVQLSVAGMSTPIFDGLAVRVGRAPQMNDERAYGSLKVNLWDPYLLAKPIVKSVTPNVPKDGQARIDLALQFNREGTFQPGKHGASVQAIVADVHLTLSAQGALDVDYTLSPVDAGDYLLELGLAFKLPASSTKLTWLGKGPYPVYPAQADGMERGVYSIAPKAPFDPLNRMYFGNRTEVSLAAATDAAGNGLGVIGQDATISLEPEKDATFFTHLLRVAGHGPKRAVSVITIKGGDLKPVSGTMRLAPLTAGQWPAVFQQALSAAENNPR